MDRRSPLEGATWNVAPSAFQYAGGRQDFAIHADALIVHSCQ
jgi:hypothetical protein